MASMLSIPTTPLIDFMAKQEDAIARANAEENQDSFKGVEEFDMNTQNTTPIIPATEVFSELFKDLNVDEETTHSLQPNSVQPKKCTSHSVPLNEVKYENKIFLDETSSFDRSEAIEFRELCRNQSHTGQTSGIASGFVQANMVALPRENATDFLKFCSSNPKGCPLLGVTSVGQGGIPTLGKGANLKTDLPKYRIWKDGVLTEEVNQRSSLPYSYYYYYYYFLSF